MKNTIAQPIDPKTIFKTPRGEAIWPKLIEPNTKFDPAGVYETRMKFSREREAEFLQQMEELYNTAYQQSCQEEARTQSPREAPPWKREADGRVVFRFKVKAGGVFDGKAWENKPPALWDAGGKRIKDPGPDLKIGNGSEGIVFFQIRPYFVQKAGITLRLKGFQILQLVDFDDASYFGVEDLGDGYRHKDSPAPDAGADDDIIPY
jgi:hypothetical protein